LKVEGVAKKTKLRSAPPIAGDEDGVMFDAVGETSQSILL
jgi:hypothetical protein